MLDYLHENGYKAAFEAFSGEAKLDYVADGKQKYSGLLEKKWTSVIRLQKKVMDLEKQTGQLQEELANAPVRKQTSSVDWIPR